MKVHLQSECSESKMIKTIKIVQVLIFLKRLTRNRKIKNTKYKWCAKCVQQLEAQEVFGFSLSVKRWTFIWFFDSVVSCTTREMPSTGFTSDSWTRVQGWWVIYLTCFTIICKWLDYHSNCHIPWALANTFLPLGKDSAPKTKNICSSVRNWMLSMVEYHGMLYKNNEVG